MSIDEPGTGYPGHAQFVASIDSGERELPLSVSSVVTDASVRVTASGEVDISTAPLLRIELADALNDGDSVVIDLTDVTFMDSHGLRVLIEAMVASDEGSFVVSAASPNVRRLIHVSGLEHSFGMLEREH